MSKRNKGIAVAALALLVIIIGIFLVKNQKSLILTGTNILSAEDTIIVQKRIQQKRDALSGAGKEVADLDKGNLLLSISQDERLLGEYEKSKSDIERAIKLGPDNGNYHHAYSVLLFDMGDPESAMSEIDKAIEITVQNANFWKWKITLYEKMNKSKDDVKKLYEEAIQKSGNVDIVTQYARYLETNEELQSAIDQWSYAAKINPTKKDIYQQEITRLTSMLAPGGTQGR